MVKRKLQGEIKIEKVYNETGEHDGRFMVWGGHVKNFVWVVNEEIVFDVDGQPFIKLAATDESFRTLCGVPLRANAFMEGIIPRRKNAVEKVVADELSKSVDLCRASKLKQDRARTQLFETHFDKLPQTVNIPDQNAPNGALQVKFEKDNRRCISVCFTAETMAFMVNEIRAHANCGESRLKSKKADRHTFKYPEVRQNGDSSPLFVRYRDSDGFGRYKSEPLPEHDENDPEDVERATDAVVELLHKFYEDNHHDQSHVIEDDAENGIAIGDNHDTADNGGAV